MKRARKIDLHTHVLPEHWPDLDARYGYSGFIRLAHQADGTARMMRGSTCFRVVEANCWSPERRLEECDRDGVDLQVLSTVPVMFSYWAKAADAHDLAKLLNDHIGGIVTSYPTRFLGLGMLPMQDPGLAIRELERCVRDLRFPGVQIGTHIDGKNLDDPALFAVFEAAADLGAALFVHPWDMLAPERMERYWLRWLVGMPCETAIAICSMMFGGVLERLPTLRVAFAHGGGAFPGTLGRIEHGFEARPDLCATATALPPRAQVGRLWFDSLVHDAEALRFLMQLVGARRICLGSDYPFPLGEARPGTLIESLEGISEDDRMWMLAGAAREFLEPAPRPAGG